MSWARYFAASNKPGAPPPPGWVRFLNFTLALLVIALVFVFSFHRLAFHLRWDSIYAYRRVLLKGWLTTLWISLASLGLSGVIGLVFALAQRSHFLVLRYFSKIYIVVIRGPPLLVQVLIFFYVVADAFRISDRYLVGVLTLSCFSGAYIAEIIRAGIESVGKSQIESARAIGLTRAQTYRYVIFPQALRQTRCRRWQEQFVSLIKDSSLLYVIGMTEFTYSAKTVASNTLSTFETYIPLAVGYLILTLPISLWTRHLERKHKYET